MYTKTQESWGSREQRVNCGRHNQSYIYFVYCFSHLTDSKLHEGRQLSPLAYCCIPSIYNGAWHMAGAQ